QQHKAGKDAGAVGVTLILVRCLGLLVDLILTLPDDGRSVLVLGPLLGRLFQGYRARLPAEGVKAGPGDVRALKEFLGLLQDSPDVPGDEIHIAAEKAGGSAGEGEDLRAVASGEHFLQLVPEGEDLLRSFLLPQGVQGIAEEAR